MTVCRTKIFADTDRGASMSEVLLAIAIVALATPFLYSQFAAINESQRDMDDANKIIELLYQALHSVRLNQHDLPAPA